MEEKRLLEGNANEIFKELYTKHNQYIEYQNRLKENFGVFWCPYHEEVHPLADKVHSVNFCREGYNKTKSTLVMKKYYENKKKKVLTK